MAENKRRPWVIQAEANVSEIREASFEGQEWVVLPVIALIEGVFWAANSPKPELALAEEFGRFPSSWNGRPVVLNHPEADGQRVGANHPEILENSGMGLVFNARMEDKKLKLEAWINKAKVEAAGGEQKELLDLALAGEPIEVSVGFFGRIEEARGVFEGREYFAVWRDILPDHLAFLETGVKGACSNEDGCGAPRTAFAALAAKTPEARWMCQGNNTCKCGGTCMAGETTETETGETTELQQPKEVAKDTPGFLGMLKRVGTKLMQFRSAGSTISDRDTHTALEQGLKESGESWPWIVAVFDDHFVYLNDRDDLVRRGFSISEDGTISLGAEVEKVRPVTEFVPIVVEETQTEEERSMAESQGNNPPGDTTTQSGNSSQTQEDRAASETTTTNTPPPQPQTVEELLKDAPEHLRAEVEQAIAAQQAQKDELIEQLQKAKGNEFTEKELQALPVASLRKMASLARSSEDSEGLADFSGRPGTRSEQPRNANAAPKAPKVFPIEKAGG